MKSKIDSCSSNKDEATVHWTVLHEQKTSFHHVCPAIFPATSSASTDYHNGNSSADSPIPAVTSNRQTLEEIITRQSNASTIVVQFHIGSFAYRYRCCHCGSRGCPRILKASETRFEQTLLLRSLAIQIIGCIKFSYISDIFFFFCKSRITSNTYRTI